MTDRGAPASYFTLTEGTPVYSSDDERLGKVKRVLGDFENDVFDGLVVATRHGERFVEAARVESVYERAVVLALPAAEARSLPGPPPVPPVIEFPRDEMLDRLPPPESDVGRLRRAWRRMFRRH
jgi:PRC-barrel domain protein